MNHQCYTYNYYRFRNSQVTRTQKQCWRRLELSLVLQVVSDYDVTDMRNNRDSELLIEKSKNFTCKKNSFAGKLGCSIKLRKHRYLCIDHSVTSCHPHAWVAATPCLLFRFSKGVQCCCESYQFIINSLSETAEV